MKLIQHTANIGNGYLCLTVAWPAYHFILLVVFLLHACRLAEHVVTRSQAVARIADPTASQQTI